MGWLQTSYPRVPLGSTATVTLFTSLCSFCLSSFLQESACQPKKILWDFAVWTHFYSFFSYPPFLGCERKNKAGTQPNNPGAVLEHPTQLSLAAHHHHRSVITMKRFRCSSLQTLTCPKGSKWLLVSLSFWKETSCLIQWAPAAGESGCTYSRPGMAGSALPATILTADAGKQTSNKEISSRWEEPRHQLLNVGAEPLMLKISNRNYF